MASVSVKNLSGTYPGAKRGETRTLKNVSFDIADGNFAVLAGPRGSGKSAILRLIAGLNIVAQGEIYIGDKRANDLAPKDRDIAMVFRDYALYPHMSVYDNLAFGLKLRKFSTTESKRRVADTASILGLDPVLGQKPGSLERSQKLRVALGRAIARKPRILLLDDPLSSLEPSTRNEMRAELVKLHQRLRATAIYVTQQPVEAMMLADQAVVMNDGALQQADAPMAVYGRPANLFVAGYFGESPMNFVPGKFKQEGAKLRFIEDDGGTISVSFSLSDRPDLEAFSSRNIILGIRPEGVEILQSSGKEARAAGNGFAAILDLVEPAGAETKVHVNTGAHSLVCRSQRFFDRNEAGHRMQFQIDLSSVHFFDPETTKRLF